MVSYEYQGMDLNETARETVLWHARNCVLPGGISGLIADGSSMMVVEEDSLIRVARAEGKRVYVTRRTVEKLRSKNLPFEGIEEIERNDRIIDAKTEIEKNPILKREEEEILRPLSEAVTKSVLEEEVRKRFSAYYDSLSKLYERIREKEEEKEKAFQIYTDIIARIVQKGPIAECEVRYATPWRLLRQEIESANLKLPYQRGMKMKEIARRIPGTFDVDAYEGKQGRRLPDTRYYLKKCMKRVGRCIEERIEMEEAFRTYFTEKNNPENVDRESVLCAYSLVRKREGARTALVSKDSDQGELLGMRKNIQVEYENRGAV